jgi:hypothetical protein
VSFRNLRKLALTGFAALSLAYFGCGSDDGGQGSAGGGGTSASGGGGSGGTSTGGTDTGGAGGTGSIAFGGAAGGGGTGAGPDACASTIVASKLVPANLLFVIDRSGSMNCNLPSDGQSTANCEAFPAPLDNSKPTKWDLTKTALKSAVSDLETSGNVSAGLVVFPRPNTECQVTDVPDVDVAPLTTAQNTAIASYLDGVVPKGKTPLAGATTLAYQHLYNLLTDKTNPITGNLFVVLLTDGFETCAESEIPTLLNTNMPNAKLINVRTFVIGVPGSEDGRSLLSEMAYQGDTAKSTTCTHSQTVPPTSTGDCHFDMTTSPNFSQDLKNALAQISGTVLSCEIDVPAAPPGKKINYNNVQVEVNQSPVAQTTSDCSTSDGWQFSTDKSKIYLCGTACDNAKKPNAQIALDLGCLSDVR